MDTLEMNTHNKPQEKSSSDENYWTDKKPDSEGFWWYKAPNETTSIQQIRMGGILVEAREYGGKVWWSIDRWGGKWASLPIEMP